MENNEQQAPAEQKKIHLYLPTAACLLLHQAHSKPTPHPLIQNRLYLRSLCFFFFLINSYIPMVWKKKIIRLTKSASNDTLDIYKSTGPTTNFPVPQSNQNEPSSTDWKQALSYIECTPTAATNLWINNALNFLLWASEAAPSTTIKVNTHNIRAFEFCKPLLCSHPLRGCTTLLDGAYSPEPSEGNTKLCQS